MRRSAKVIPDVFRSDGVLLSRLAQRLDCNGSGRGFVVADDKRKSRTTRIGAFHLRFEASATGVHHEGMTGIAQFLGDTMSEPRRRIADVDDVCERRIAHVLLGKLQQQNHPFDAHREAARGRGLSAKLLEQPIVATTAGHCALRTQAIGNPLEHGAVVIVEPAHQTWIDRVGNAGVGQQLRHAFEVRSRG